MFVEGKHSEGNEQLEFDDSLGFDFSEGYADTFMVHDTDVVFTGILLGDVSDTYSSISIM